MSVSVSVSSVHPRPSACPVTPLSPLPVQVLNASLLEGEVLSLEDTGGPGPSLLANESVLMRGLVVRSHSNQISISFRSDRGQGRSGFVILRYQGEWSGGGVVMRCVTVVIRCFSLRW